MKELESKWKAEGVFSPIKATESDLFSFQNRFGVILPFDSPNILKYVMVRVNTQAIFLNSILWKE